MTIQRIDLETFKIDNITLEQFLKEPGIEKFYDALTMIKTQKRLSTGKYGYILEG